MLHVRTNNYLYVVYYSILGAPNHYIFIYKYINMYNFTVHLCRYMHYNDLEFAIKYMNNFQ